MLIKLGYALGHKEDTENLVTEQRGKGCGQRHPNLRKLSENKCGKEERGRGED